LIVRVDGEHIFQAGALIVDGVHQPAQPEPAVFIVRIEFDGFQQQRARFIFTPGLQGGCTLTHHRFDIR
jgi:hypothetical protein